MVQNVVFSQCVSKYSNQIGKVLKRNTNSSQMLKSAFPLLIGGLTLLSTKKNKIDKDIFISSNKNATGLNPIEMKPIDLNPVQYSAWARLNDLGNYKEEQEYSINSKDSNKWNKVFRS